MPTKKHYRVFTEPKHKEKKEIPPEVFEPREGEPIFSQRLRQARIARGLSRPVLAKIFRERVGGEDKAAQEIIAKWEDGVVEPRSGRLLPLAKILHVTVDWLLGDDEDETDGEGADNYTPTEIGLIDKARGGLLEEALPDLLTIVKINRTERDK